MRPLRLACALTALAACVIATAEAHVLYPNTPDPFCPDNEPTLIEIALSQSAHVHLGIEDIFGGQLITLVDGLMEAGLHMVMWQGEMAAGDTLRAGVFTIRLLVDDTSPYDPFEPNEEHEEPVTAFCGSDLEGPFYRRTAAGDLAVAFAAALDRAGECGLFVLTSDQLLVREFALQFDVPGVQMAVWDLRDESGERVPAGVYICRFQGPGYTEDITFEIQPAEPSEPIHLTAFFTEATGIERELSIDSASPTPLLTPLLSARIEFGRRLGADELQCLMNSLTGSGSLEYVHADSEIVAPDTSAVYVDSFHSTRLWDDIFGPGQLQFDPFWADPAAFYFQLHHDFEGITHTSAECDTIGPVDPDDWQCRQDTRFRDLPVEFCLNPACPNPVALGNHTTLYFALAANADVYLVVADIQGNLTRTLVDGHMSAGYHAVIWDLRDDYGAPVPHGIYRVIMEIGLQPDIVCAGDVQVIDPAAIPDQPRLSEGLTLECSPNPVLAGSQVRILCGAATSAQLSISVNDVTGRRIRELSPTWVSALNRHVAIWDGLGDHGETLPTGVYFIRSAIGMHSAKVRVLLVD